VTLLRLPRRVYQELRAHGEETYPDECCGALLGRPILDQPILDRPIPGPASPRAWLVHSAVRAGNTRTDSAHNRYQIAPAELVRIARDARGQDLEIAGFYHSHPDHPAQWSPTDLEEAHWLGCFYVITQVTQGRAAQTNAFLLGGETEESKRFESQMIEILDA
jgi:proteasome lid subunit RPN8/RPN11